MKRLVFGIFIAHFTLVTFSVFENVHLISPRLPQGIAHLYATPFFEQNWGMFSNPPQTTKRVYFQFQHPAGDSMVVSDWYDVNTSMYNYNQQHLFSVAQRLIKYESSCLNNIFRHIRECQDATPDACIEQSAGFLALRNYARIIYKNGAQEPVAAGTQVQFVLKVVEEIFPPYEDRHLDYFDKENYEFAVHTTKAYDLI